jgi:transposase
VVKLKVLAIDLAKRVFQLHGVDERGVAVLRKQLKRHQLLAYLAQLPPCVIAMETCGGAHYWARQVQKLGHTARLIAPQYVKPFVKGNKNDRNDAQAICEAALRPDMRFVPVKSEEQQALSAQHCVRELLMKQRTALSNQCRGLLAEFGIVLPKGLGALRAQLPVVLADAENTLSVYLRELIAQLYERLRELDEQIKCATRRIEQQVRDNPGAQRLMQRRGIGLLGASALSAEVDPSHFHNGRHLAAWIGLVPRQHSTGGKTVLLGISKRGNKRLRTLLIHGARAVVRTAAGKDDVLSRWIVQLTARRGVHRTIVAVANKLARYAWADLMSVRAATALSVA